MFKTAVGIALMATFLGGCAKMYEKTNILSDADIKSETSGVLGYSPGDLAIQSRRTSGTNTYVNLKAKDGREFTCLINGGNLLTFGIINPPSCAKRGEPLNANPFQR